MAKVKITLPGARDMAKIQQQAMRATIKQAAALITIYAGRGLGSDGRPVVPYSASYRNRKTEAGRRGKPDFTLTGQYLRAIRGGAVSVTDDGRRGNLVIGGAHRGAAPVGGSVRQTGAVMPVAELATYLDERRPHLGIKDSKRLNQLARIAQKAANRGIREYNGQVE